MVRLLEREGELDALTGAVDDAVRGTGCLLLVGGEAGIGKTSLVRALQERVAGDVSLLWGACEPLSVPIPLQPLRELARSAGAGDLAEIGSDDRLVLAHALLDSLAERAPAVAVIEDAHWSDPLSLDLLRILARRVEAAGVVIVMTYRDDEAGANPQLTLLLGDLATNPAARRIALRPLSVAAVGELAGASGLDGRRVASATGGNPFLVVETIAAGGRLPASVRDAALARAGRLSVAARGVVEVAAVIGQHFKPGLLSSLTAEDPSALEEALARGMLVADGERLGFRHELIRDALEQSISPARRVQLHARVFQALVEVDGVDSARLAHHAERGGLTEAACRFAIRAAEDAERVGALREIALQCERALRHGSGLAPEERCDLLVRYARALDFSSLELDDTAALAREAVALAEELDDPVRLWRALEALAWTQWSLEYVTEARAAVERAIAVLEPVGQTEELARAHALRMRVEATAFDPAAAIAAAPRALELAAEAGSEDVRIDIGISVALARGHQGSRDAVGDLLGALEAARRRALPFQTIRTYVNLMTLGVAFRDHALVDRVRDEALPLFAELDVPLVSLAIDVFRARSLLDRGRWADAQEIFERSDRTIQAEWPVARAFAGLIRARRGDPAAAGEVQRGWELLREMVAPESARHGMVRLALIETAWLAGDHGAALRELRAARESPAVTRFARSGGELALWASRYGVELELPAAPPGPVMLELDGDWRGAVRAWRELEAPYEAALAALPGDERAAREALASLHRLGATGAARAFGRERATRGAREARGPRRSTLANPAGLTRREQEVLEALATGVTNLAIAAELHLSERTVAHHISAILDKLGARNRHQAIERARAKGVLPQHGQVDRTT